MQLKVKELLKQRGMKMTELAAKVGVDQSNLSKSLDGNPTLSRLEDIAKVLGVPVRELLPDAPPTSPAGVLDMGGKRFALVPLPDEEAEEAKALPEAQNLSPGALQNRIFSLAERCTEDGKTRTIYGFLAGHLVVVVHDGVSKRYLRLLWEKDGSVTMQDYPSCDYEGWEIVQLAELMVHDIISTTDL